MSLWNRLSVIFVRSSHRHNAVWHKSTNDLVATRQIRPGERIVLRPPTTESQAITLAEPPPPKQHGRHPYDIEREPWVKTGSP